MWGNSFCYWAEVSSTAVHHFPIIIALLIAAATIHFMAAAGRTMPKSSVAAMTTAPHSSRPMKLLLSFLILESTPTNTGIPRWWWWWWCTTSMISSGIIVPWIRSHDCQDIVNFSLDNFGGIPWMMMMTLLSLLLLLDDGWCSRRWWQGRRL